MLSAGRPQTLRVPDPKAQAHRHSIKGLGPTLEGTSEKIPAMTSRRDRPRQPGCRAYGHSHAHRTSRWNTVGRQTGKAESQGRLMGLTVESPGSQLHARGKRDRNLGGGGLGAGDIISTRVFAQHGLALQKKTKAVKSRRGGEGRKEGTCDPFLIS